MAKKTFENRDAKTKNQKPQGCDEPKTNDEQAVKLETADKTADKDACETPSEDADEAVYHLTQKQFNELKERIDALEKQKDEYIALAQRVQSDFDNFRRRNNSVRADSMDDGVKETVKALLPALDNLERALSSAESSGEASAFLEGVDMVHRQIIDILKKMGVEVIEAGGKPFDPELHNAVMQEQREGVSDGLVLEELQKGYTLKEKVIRHSMVKVST